MSDVFTKADPAAFDLDSWIDGAKLPEKSVTVFGRADLVARYYELEQQLSEERNNADERLGGQSPATIAVEMTKVRDAMHASALTFTFRALLDEETAKAKKDHPANEDARTYAMLSVQAVKPAVPAEKWPMIRSKIGEGQFMALLEAAAGASYDRTVSVPFSLAHSAALSTLDS